MNVDEMLCTVRGDTSYCCSEVWFCFDILKAFFVRHSSEYKTSDSDRKVYRNIYPDAVTRDRMRLIDPKSGQLQPIHHCCLVEEL